MSKEKQGFEQLRNQMFEVLFWSLIEEEEGTKLMHRELSQRMHEQILAVNTSRYLEAMGYFCLHHQLPMLPVLVVNEKTKFPGTRFKRIYDQYYDSVDLDVEALYERELDRIYQFGYWDKLASHLKLDEILIMRFYQRSKNFFA